MAGTWLAVVEGFGGMRILDCKVHLNPLIPVNWKSYLFHARSRDILFEVRVTQNDVMVNNLSEKLLKLVIYGIDYTIKGSGTLVTELKKDFFK
jgi:maltose phosphorylase